MVKRYLVNYGGIMNIQFLCKENVKDYISYLSEAIETDVDNMHIDSITEEDFLKRIEDPFYMNTKSLLAFEDGKIIGRLEYHFYGCFQDGICILGVCVKGLSS